jgi:hypothetical protein
MNEGALILGQDLTGQWMTELNNFSRASRRVKKYIKVYSVKLI